MEVMLETSRYLESVNADTNIMYVLLAATVIGLIYCAIKKALF